MANRRDGRGLDLPRDSVDEPRRRARRPRLPARSPFELGLRGLGPAANDVAIEDLGTLTIDVVDEATPVLACARNTAGKGVDGHVEVLLPVAAAGLGAVRIVVRGELRAGARHREFVWRYVLPVLVVADGARELTLAGERT